MSRLLTNIHGMKNYPDTMKVDDVEYVRKDSVKKPAEKLDGMDYCIIRTYSAGCFAGYVKTREGQEATILKARRLWYWSGASSLSQIAMEGVKNPQECKFAMEVDKVVLTNVIEVINATKEAQENINNVPVWKE